MTKNIDFNQAFVSLSNSNIKPVYFLVGSDQFLQDYFINELESCLFKNQPIDKAVLMADDIGSKEVVNKLNESDLFSSKKLFILRNPNSLRGKTREEFIDYCSNPNTQHYLVIVYEEFVLKNKFLKTLGTNHGVISVSTPFENEMVKWVKKFFEQNGVRNISGILTKKIIEAYGDSLFSLQNEIDKLSLNFSGDSEFTDDELDNFISSTRGYKKFELFNYLGKKETFLSLKLGRSLVSQDSSMLELLKPLNEFYQELLFAKIFSGTNQAKKSFSLLAPSILRQLPMYANNYSGKEIVSALKRLGKIDKQIKSSQIDDESAITEFIFSATSDG